MVIKLLSFHDINLNEEVITDYAIKTMTSDLARRILDFSIVQPWSYEGSFYNEQLVVSQVIDYDSIANYLMLDIQHRCDVLQYAWKCIQQSKQYMSEKWMKECLLMKKAFVDIAIQEWNRVGVKLKLCNECIYVTQVSSDWSYLRFEEILRNQYTMKDELHMLRIMVRHTDHYESLSDRYSKIVNHQLNLVYYKQVNQYQKGEAIVIEIERVIDVITRIHDLFLEYCLQQQVMFWTMED